MAKHTHTDMHTNTNNHIRHAPASTQVSSTLQMTLPSQLELLALNPLSRHNGKSTGQAKRPGKTGFDSMPDCTRIHFINNEEGGKKGRSGPPHIVLYKTELLTDRKSGVSTHTRRGQREEV